jgi:hypothetical protein
LGRKALELPSLPTGFRISLHDIITRLPTSDIAYRALFKLSAAEGNCFQFLSSLNDIIITTASQQFAAALVVPEDAWNVFKPRLPDSFLTEFEPEPLRLPHPSGFLRLVSKTRSPQRPELEILITRHVALANNTAYVLAKITSGAHEYKFCELELLYLFTFFLSSLARYQPHIWNDVQSGKDDLAAAVVNDVLEAAENRFLPVLQQHLRLFDLIV